MNSIVHFLITFLFVVLLFAVETAAQTKTTVLEVGKRVERLLKVGETHTYKISAVAGQYLHVEVDEILTDVVVSLFSPEGKKLVVVNGARFIDVPERLHALTEAAGEYRLEVSVAPYQGGVYSVKLAELRPTVPSDNEVIKAAMAMYEGSRVAGKYDDFFAKAPSEQTLNAAIEKHLEAITLFRAANNFGGEIDALQHIGDIYVKGLGRGSLKNISVGIEYFEKSLELAEKIGDKQRTAPAYYNLGRANTSAGNHMKANEFYDRAFPIYEALGNKYLMWALLSDKGQNYHAIGEYDNALMEFERSLSVGETIPNFYKLLGSLGSIGNVYSSKGNHWKALKYKLKALEHAKKFDSPVDIARQYMNIGSTYMSLGNNELAVNYFQKSYEKFDELSKDRNDKSNGIPVALLNIGIAYQNQGKYDEALKKYQEAIENYEQLKNQNPSRGFAVIFHGMGEIYQYQGNFERSLEYFDRSLEIKKDYRNKRGYIELLVAIAEHYVIQGNFEKGRKYLEEAAAIAEQNGYFEPDWRRNFVFGKLYVGSKQSIKARQSFDEAIKNVETLRAQGSPFGGMTQPYVEMVRLLSSEGKATEAFSYAERVKSRSLLDVLQNGKIDISKAMSAEEREMETRLKKEMASLNTKISSENDKTRLDDLQKQLKTKRLEFEDFQTRLYALKPELKVQRGEMSPVSLEEAGKLVTDEKSALLEYVVGEDRSFLFVITKGAAQKVLLKIYPIEIKQKDLAEKTQIYRSKIAKGVLDFAKESQDLYSLLIKPAEAQLKNKSRLVIVPDNALWEMPFQTLQPAQNKYLIEQASVSYAPSVTALNEMAKKNKDKRFSGATLLAFGNPTVNKATSDQLKQVLMSDSLGPLPEAERLVNSLQRMYGANRSKVLVGNEAREETAKTESSKFRIVQFAAHGILNDFSPMYSNIVLAQKQGNPDEDGLLEAWEMKDLDLNADMVVLSACETARGKVSSGEGVIGMSWALFIAGAPTTVASQWKVDSTSTTESMLEFHRQLLSKKKIAKAEALRRASLKVMKMPGYKHPFFWAGFVLVGDGS